MCIYLYMYTPSVKIYIYNYIQTALYSIRAICLRVCKVYNLVFEHSRACAWTDMYGPGQGLSKFTPVLLSALPTLSLALLYTSTAGSLCTFELFRPSLSRLRSRPALADPQPCSAELQLSRPGVRRPGPHTSSSIHSSQSPACGYQAAPAIFMSLKYAMALSLSPCQHV